MSLVIGGKNSAAIAALELWRHGARVTLVHRGSDMHRHVKYWIQPDIENRIKNGEITRLFQHQRDSRSPPDPVTARHALGGDRHPLPNDFVFALTGYLPDFGFLQSLGVRIEGAKTAAPSAIRPASKATSPASISPASSWPATAPMRSSSRTADSTAARSPQTSN